MQERSQLKIIFALFFLLLFTFVGVEASGIKCSSGNKIDFYYAADDVEVIDKGLIFNIYSDKSLNHKIGRIIYTYTFAEIAENGDETFIGIASIFLPKGTISYVYGSTQISSNELFHPGVYLREITSGTDCFLLKRGLIKINVFDSGLRHVKIRFKKTSC